VRKRRAGVSRPSAPPPPATLPAPCPPRLTQSYHHPPPSTHTLPTPTRSWWYFKEPNKGALILWEPMPTYFPDGMAPWLQLPLVLHNRYFSPTNDYIAMGYKFYSEPGATLVLPIDVDMFKYIMTKARKWGMITYEQDWLITVYQGLDGTQSNISLARTWLHAMGDAAAALGVTIQYCMPLINHMLESTTIPAVTNARASGDYHPGTDQWDIGLSSLFYFAIGIQPSKDDFWTTEFQPNSPYGDKPTEPNWQLQAFMTTLSTGPVGPSDMLGGINATLIMSTCRAGDGLLLRPDKPITTVDSAFAAAVWGAPGWGAPRPAPVPAVPVTTGEGSIVVGTPFAGDLTVPDVLMTHSAHGHGAWRWHYLLAVRLPGPYPLPWSDLGDTGAATEYAVVDWFNPGAGATPFPAGGTYTIAQGTGQPSAPANAHTLRYFVLAPVLPGGWVLVGEAGKITTMAHQRTTNVTTTAAGFTATVHTAQAETSVTYWVVVPAAARAAVAAAGGHVDAVTGAMPVTCATSRGLDATLACAGNGCTCA
jgi:hypothetical protein